MEEIKSYLRTIIRFFKFRKIDRQLKEKYWMEIKRELIANLKVIGNRSELIDKFPKDATVAEVGVAEGDFSDEILQISKPQKFILIDPWDSRRYGEKLLTNIKSKFSKEINEKTIEIKRGYSTVELAKFPDGYFDWIYIDANHSFENVMDDLEIASQKVKKNGIISGHDYTRWSGVQRFGVVEAVNTFCNEEKWNFIYLTNEPHRHLSFAIQRS